MLAGKDEAAYTVIRLRRDDGRVDEYPVPRQEGMNVLSALQYIYENLDRTVAYPVCLCKFGKCGACAVRVDGKAVLGCAARVEGDTMLIEPLGDDVIRDLVMKG